MFPKRNQVAVRQCNIMDQKVAERQETKQEQMVHFHHDKRLIATSFCTGSVV